MINDFIGKFTSKEIKYIHKFGKRYYFVNDSLWDKYKFFEFESIGVFLGESDRKFKPSVELLRMISDISDKKIFLNDDGEWFFLCGRDIMGKSIIKTNVKKGLVLVQNKNDENLGYGRLNGDINNKEKIVLDNILDRGSYLRIEK